MVGCGESKILLFNRREWVGFAEKDTTVVDGEWFLSYDTVEGLTILLNNPGGAVPISISVSPEVHPALTLVGLVYILLLRAFLILESAFAAMRCSLVVIIVL